MAELPKNDPFAESKCTYCFQPIVGVKITCAECVDFDLCPQCYAAGAEIGQHKKDHRYRFDVPSLRLFQGKSVWTAREELNLLTGLEKFGFGNWKAIADHVKTRTPDEVRDEYINRFVNGSIGRATWSEAYEERAKRPTIGLEDNPPQPKPTKPPLGISPDEAKQLGYLPHRDTFDTEFDNDAELLVSALKMSSSDDDELYTALKLAHVDMYLEKLKERARRKRICKEYLLIHKFFAAQREITVGRKKSPTYEQEFEEKLRWLSQFQTSIEQDCLIKDMLRERELKHRLNELIKYRKHGLTRIEELAHYEQEMQVTRGADSSALRSRIVTSERNVNEGVGSSSTEKSYTYHIDNPILSPEPELLPQPQLQLQKLIGRYHPHLCEPSKHLLTVAENDLCNSLGLTPSQYISIKTLLLISPKESAVASPYTEIFNFLQSSGWFISL